MKGGINTKHYYTPPNPSA